MPEIPLFSGSQVLNPSSPVPAVSGTTAQEALGEVVSGFGHSLNEFGQRLDAAAKKAKSDSDALQVAIIEDKLKKEFIGIRQKIAAEQVDQEDTDGSKAAARFDEEAQKRIKFYTDFFGDTTMKARIVKASGDSFNESYGMVYANEIKKIEENRSIKEQEWLGGMLSDLETSPQNIGKHMARAEIYVTESTHIPQFKKAAALQEMNKAMATSVAQGYILKGEMDQNNPAQWYDRGIKVLGTLSTRIPPEELKKIQDDLIQKRNFRVNFVNDQVRFDRTQKQWTREDLQDRFIFEASAAISQDPTNEKMSEQIINNLTNNPVFYSNPEKIAQVQNLKTVGSKLADDRVEAEFSRMMAAGASGNQLASYANSLYGPNVTQRASAKKVGELLQMAARIRESERSDPQRTMIRTQLLGAIEKLSTDAKYRNNPVTQYKFQRAGAIYALKEAAYGKNPTIEQMRAAANDVVKDITGVSNEFSAGAAKEIPIPDAMTFDKEALKKGATSMARTMITSGPRTRAQLEQMYKDSIALKQRAGKLPEQKPMESLQPQAPNNIPTIPFKQFNR